ncbi:hypothetical protein LCGC14_2046270 [marine sediment metagenome]|uniref:Uncharacterized protein n=1 Tax=marine sediment metagenome TaxID=412755 RepID=A0A0F9EQC6_9ZZZZ
MKITFEEYKKAIDNFLLRKVGLSSDDLPDICYRDNYDMNVSVARTARQAIENCGY